MGQVPIKSGLIKRVTEFSGRVSSGRKLSMVTCYDAASAKILAGCDVDTVLVGDSVAMVVHGYESTLMASVEMMASHTAAVRRGLGPESFIVSDLPFPWHRKGAESALEAVDVLMKAGASAVKIEGAMGHIETVQHLVESGVPVMGHLGLVPQSVNQLGGYRVQGRDSKAAERLLDEARMLEAVGVFAIVLECVPADLAQRLTESLSIPTIGIGSGPGCSGQVLVWQDLLGMQEDFKPRFVRRFSQGSDWIRSALNQYADAVNCGDFPSAEESFK